MSVPRVAYFPDSYHEVNGVAHTSRKFVAYARRKQLPFLCVRAADRGSANGQEARSTETDELWELDLARSRTAVRLEKDLEFDAIFWRHFQAIEWALKRFRPDVIHITGPSELGFLGAMFAWRMGVPLAASWHTNVHEYLARRSVSWLGSITRLLPGGMTGLPEQLGVSAGRGIEAATLEVTLRFYRQAKVLFAPNRELCALLEQRTGTRCHLMQRGVDTEMYAPEKRRPGSDGRTVLGYVGRLSVEKNIALLVRVAEELKALGLRDVRFTIVGQGGDEALLRRQLPEAEFAGVLRGEALAAAYAGMDLFLFPSHTDTFGNVVLEALASGVPAVVTPEGGPKFIVRHGVTGCIAEDDAFGAVVAGLVRDPARLAAMGVAAREYALGCSWDAVFGSVYAGYETALKMERPARS